MGLDGDSMKRKKILLILLILLLVAGRFSFESFIDLSLLSEGRFLLGIAFIALIAVHLSKGTTINKKSLTSLIFLLLVLIFFYIMILTSFYSPDKAMAVKKVIDILYLFILTVGSYFILRLYSNYNQVLKVTAFTFLFIGLIYMIPICFSVLTGANRATTYIGGPNVVTRLLFFALVSSGYLYSLKRKVRYIWFLTLFFIGIILIGSRGGMVGAFVSLGLFLFIYVSSKPTSLKAIFNKRALGIAVVVSPLIIALSDYFIKTFRERFILLLVDNIYYSSRDIIYENTLEAIIEKPIFGHGLNAYSAVVGGPFYYPHNIILEVLIDSGVLGLIPFIMVLLFSLICIYKHRKSPMLVFAVTPFYMIIVSMLSGDLYDFRYYFFWILILLVPLGYSNDNKAFL